MGMQVGVWEASLKCSLAKEGVQRNVYDEDVYPHIAKYKSMVRRQAQQDRKDDEVELDELSESDTDVLVISTKLREKDVERQGSSTKSRAERIRRADQVLRDDEKAHYAISCLITEKLYYEVSNKTAREAYEHVVDYFSRMGNHVHTLQAHLSKLTMDDLSRAGVKAKLAEREVSIARYSRIFPEHEEQHWTIQTRLFAASLPQPFDQSRCTLTETDEGRIAWDKLKSSMLLTMSFPSYEEQLSNASLTSTSPKALSCSYCHEKGHFVKHCKRDGAAKARHDWWQKHKASLLPSS